MAITKKPLIRYKILDACFRNPYKNYTKELLMEKVNEELYEITGDESHCIKLRQLQDDIAFMKSAEGWSIELAELFDGKKRIYRYEDTNFSINNAPLNAIEMDEFQSAIQALSQFEGMPQFEGIQEIIAKLKYDLKGIEYFSFLYNAVQNKTPLLINYKDFKAEEPYEYILHPYYLKQYNNRWFLYGLRKDFEKSDYNVAIDRIVTIEVSDDKFIPNTQIDWQEYFSDMIGVSKPVDGTIEEVVLHFNQLTGRYMENKSIHETQKHRWLDENTFEVRIKVYLNYELERLILSYGDSVKVMEPIHLQNIIKKRLILGFEQY